MPTSARRLNRNRSVYMAEQTCESTVATAAPRTPISSAKMQTGSSAILTAAPSMTDRIAVPEKPWLITIWFSPTLRSANTVPST